jgi:hypothetical protein
MKHFGVMNLCLTTIGILAAYSYAATKAAPKGKAARHAVALRVDPPVVVLDGPLAMQRLAVTAQFNDGTEEDVTPRASLSLSRPGIVKLENNALLKPLNDGGAQLTVAFEKLRIAIPVAAVESHTVTPVSLTNDLEPLFTKIGCNQGSCHGQQNGQGGFKLTLRGYDSAFDYEQIWKADGARRINAKEPEKSLLLIKPTMQVPHGGGPRLTKGSLEYNLLFRWIIEQAKKQDQKEPSKDKDKSAATSVPEEARLTEIEVFPVERVVPKPGLKQRILVTARYSDGSFRDVTGLARYQSQNDAVAAVDDAGMVAAKQPGESAIMVSYGGEVKVANIIVPQTVVAAHKTASLPVKPGKAPAAKGYIDRLVELKLAKLRTPVSGMTTDSEFLRRVSLDTIGTLPTPDETRAFLADRDPARRSKLIDRLLERPEFVDYRTLRVADLLRVNGQYLSEEGADVYARWIHDRVRKNVPYNLFVRELLTGRGSTFHVGPANYYRVATNPEELAEATAQSFLGVRLQCAKCHNHPFEKWKQRDYYGLASFFARVGRKGGPEFGEEQVYVRRDGDAYHPRTKQLITAKFLGGEEPKFEPESDRRVALAEWLTSKDNFDFARVAVNRTWADYFGKGIVDAVDDFRVSNPPSNGPLLDALAKDFIAHNYDVKYITRVILNSEAYQRSSEILPGNAKDERHFARAYPRRLPAEPLEDAVCQVTGKPDKFGAFPQGWRAIQLRDSRTGSYFLEVFGKPKREILCACERSQGSNLAQSLHLINSGNLNNKLASNDGRLATLLKQVEKLDPVVGNTKIIEEFYLMALCRYPTLSETKVMLKHISEAKERRKGLEDSLWALLNCEEFLFNH